MFLCLKNTGKRQRKARNMIYQSLATRRNLENELLIFSPQGRRCVKRVFRNKIVNIRLHI